MRNTVLAAVAGGALVAALAACTPPANDPLAVAMAESPSPAGHGQVAEYLVVVRNANDHAIEHIQLQVSLEANGSPARVVSEPASCHSVAGKQACQVGVLPMGNSKQYTFRVRVPSSGHLTGQATVTGAGSGYSRTTSLITTPVR